MKVTEDYIELVVRVANAAAVTAPGRAAECTRRAMVEFGDLGWPDVLLLSEVSPLEVQIIRQGREMDVVQHGRPGDPDAGVAVAAFGPDIELHELAMILGSPRTSEGGGIRLRPIVGARAFRTPWWAIHCPPSRAPLARALYIARARARRGVVGGDWNLNVQTMRRTTLRQYRGHEVLGLLIPRRIHASAVHTVDIGSDHLAVDVRLRIPRRRRRGGITHTHKKENAS